MVDETSLDEIQTLAHQLWEASGRPNENKNAFLEQAQKQVVKEKNNKHNAHSNQHEYPPKPTMDNPIIDDKDQ